MKSFVILFRQGPFNLTAAARARRQAQVSLWAREQNARGHRLEPRSLAPSVTRPGIEMSGEEYGKWPVTALLFLDARNLDEATAIAASHPAKDYNVAMEVRPWSPPAVPVDR
ncbi:MAG TPA: hypothetical protein VG734_05295 [Lacunisphaera sp.]|nr:hypothetical protein [Lacunisphaera sp.]